MRLRVLEKTRAKMETLYAQSLVGKRDVEHIYGAIFIGAYTAFESMLEDLFLKLLTSSVKASRSVKSKATFNSAAAARSIVFGGKNYLDWIPYDKTLERAEQFFYSGQPFTKLSSHEKGRIKTVCLIRNAIAHSSSHARKQFDVSVVSTLTLQPRERTPNGLLRSLHSTTPNVTRYEQLVGDLTSIAHSLTR